MSSACKIFKYTRRKIKVTAMIILDYVTLGLVLLSLSTMYPQELMSGEAAKERVTSTYVRSLEPRPYTPRFYLAALEKKSIFLQGCEIKSGRVRPGFEASMCECHPNTFHYAANFQIRKLVFQSRVKMTT